MGTKESMKEIKVITTLNSGVNRSRRDLNSKEKYKNIYKRDAIRRNAHTLKYLEESNQKIPNNKKLSTKKPLMTKEQRNLLKNILKENVKENKKTIAKNLIGIFLESNKNTSKFQIKNQANSIKSNFNNKGNNTNLKDNMNQTPKPKLYYKSDKNTKNKKNQSNNSLKKIKRFSTLLAVRPSIFSKEYKKQKEEAKNKENIKINSKQNKKSNLSEKDMNEIGKLKSDGFISKKNKNEDAQEQVKDNLNDNNNECINNNKMNFTSLFKLQQEISEFQPNQKQSFFTPRGPLQTQFVKKIALEDKKGIIFQRKSFRDYVENNNSKNYDECLKFINTTIVISHLDESDKSLLIQSLKIKNFNKDECLLKAKEKCTVLYFVKNGLLQCVDDEGACIKTLTSGDNFGEKELLTDINMDFNLITKSDCTCYTIRVRTLRKMFGHKFRNFFFYNFMKAAFDCSKLFQTMNSWYIEQIFKFFTLVNLSKDNVAFPIGHVKSSKFVIIISGHLINSKNGQVIGWPLDILFEEELISLSNEKIKYALYPSPDALFLEGDSNEILKYLRCKSFEDVLNKNIIFENLSKIILFKSFSQLKLYNLIDLINIEKYKSGEKIIKEGTKGEKFYIVKNGQVEVYQKSIYLRTLNSMEYFGERSLLTNEVRSATVIAKNDVELYCLDKESFHLNLSDMMCNYLNISLYLHDESVSLDDLLFIKEIGKGNYGSVSLVMNKRTNFPYAIKAINKAHIINENLTENIQLEKNILLKIDHPFIVKLVKCLKNDRNIFFLLEYIKGKELFDVIRDIGYLTKDQTNFYVASMMIAIQYLHERKIIYRDLKPENIIVEKNGYIKLIDFGTAKEIEDRTKTIIGTPHYMAPEIIMGGGYSFQVDFWSISICMYEFMCGEVPFGEKEEDPMEIYFAIINNHLSFPSQYITIDKEFKHLMKKMLDKNPSNRLSTFQSIKNSSWFKDFKWDELTNLNLKAPYLPIIPYSDLDFDEQCKPLFGNEKQKFDKYMNFIKEYNKDNKEEIEEKIPKEKIIEYKKWLDKF